MWTPFLRRARVLLRLLSASTRRDLTARRRKAAPTGPTAPIGADCSQRLRRPAEAERGREMRLDKGDHRSLVLWATDCAEHVLPYFEEQYPKDDRPRKAIEAARAWVRGEIALSEARAAAYAAVPSDAAAATTKERDWQYRHLPKHLRPVAFPARGNS